MSVGEDQTECPLCMEPLEMDDINFFPCTCGYQICRFCWHRIRTDENGLCPACRKAYPEDPAEFKPLTEDELQRIKKERRQKEAQRKQKAAENRKHLANVRVVQKNLVFVVGLSQRLADPEVLRKHEYFGKFGKIHKVVINQSTSYAGAQVCTRGKASVQADMRNLGPSASAYVTYHRPEDALKAIQAVNNIHVDGRTLKASLGTTKYCSHFLRGAQCPKPDCMYLHELGEEAASFTKDEMQQGKHQEYEQKLYEMFMNSQNLATNQTVTTATTTTTTTTSKTQPSRKKTSSPDQLSTGNTPPPQSTASTSIKEVWPSLPPQPSSSPIPSSKTDRLANGNKTAPLNAPHSLLSKTEPLAAQSRAPGCQRTNGQLSDSLNSKALPPSPDLSPGGSSSSLSSSGGSSSPSTVAGGSQYIHGRGRLPQLSPHHHTTPSSLPAASSPAPIPQSQPPYSSLRGAPPPPGLVSVGRKLPFQSPTDSMSLFSSSNGFPSSRNPKPPQQVLQSAEDSLPAAPEIPDTIPVSTSTDWQAAFGFSSTNQTEAHDDDLGFDPWNESTKALAEIIEKENTSNSPQNNYRSNFHTTQQHTHSTHSPSSPRQQHHFPGSGQHHSTHQHPPGGVPPHLVSSMAQISQLLDNTPKNLPPGFNHNHIGALANNQMRPQASKIMGLMQIPPVPQNSHYPDMINNDVGLGGKRDAMPQHQMPDAFNKDWQDELRALLPNIHISFGPNSQEDGRIQTPASRSQQQQQLQQHLQQQHLQRQQQQQQQQQQQLHNSHKSNTEEPPHWMASLHHLTEDSGSSAGVCTSSSNNHRMASPMAPPHMPYCSSQPTWPAQGLAGTPHPPPGFHNPQMRQVAPEVQQLADGFQ